MSNVLEQIYSNYKKPVYNYFFRLTFKSHISEELTQDTFLKAFKYFNTFRVESSVKTWLFKIARNTHITFVRKYGSVREESMKDYELEDRSDAFSSCEQKMLIRKVLKKLTEEESTLIILRDLNGFTYSEIAKIMDFTEGKVKIGLHRARSKFRNYYNCELKEG